MRRNTEHDKDAIMFFRFLDIVGTVKRNVVSSYKGRWWVSIKQ